LQHLSLQLGRQIIRVRDDLSDLGCECLKRFQLSGRWSAGQPLLDMLDLLVQVFGFAVHVFLLLDELSFGHLDFGIKIGGRQVATHLALGRCLLLGKRAFIAASQTLRVHENLRDLFPDEGFQDSRRYLMIAAVPMTLSVSVRLLVILTPVPARKVSVGVLWTLADVAEDHSTQEVEARRLPTLDLRIFLESTLCLVEEPLLDYRCRFVSDPLVSISIRQEVAILPSMFVIECMANGVSFQYALGDTHLNP
jgi:hypothetical protein